MVKRIANKLAEAVSTAIFGSKCMRCGQRRMVEHAPGQFVCESNVCRGYKPLVN